MIVNNSKRSSLKLPYVLYEQVKIILHLLKSCVEKILLDSLKNCDYALCFKKKKLKL